jgi:metallo-beta-lactamase family protein
VVVVESTYGNRHHDDEGGMALFSDAVASTLRRGGTVLIPAFAVDRTEVVLFRLRELVASGAIPSVPVFVDSPMALSALRAYREAIAAGAADIDPELAAMTDPFDPGQLVEIRDVEESRAGRNDYRTSSCRPRAWPPVAGCCTTWPGCCRIRATRSSCPATRRPAPGDACSPTAPAR